MSQATIREMRAAAEKAGECMVRYRVTVVIPDGARVELTSGQPVSVEQARAELEDNLWRHFSKDASK